MPCARSFFKIPYYMAFIKKFGEEVSEGIRIHVLAHYGLPNIFQSDNGTEFVNHLVEKLIEKHWRGKCLKLM